jgi:hypothetical protein
VCACAVHRQGRTGIGWGRAALQRYCHGGAAAAERRRRHSDLCSDLDATTSSATGRAGPRGAHQGLGLTGAAAQGGRRRGPSGEDRRRSWGRSMQGVSRLLIPTGRLVVFLLRCYGG